MYNKGSYLIHFGILGQKWGVRRYQNEDGTLTEEGKKRYLANYDELPGNAVYSHDAGNVYNNAIDKANQGIKEINKKWDKIRPQGFAGEDVESLKANLEYTKEVRDMYQSAYRDALAKDMGTDPSTLSGQKWLNDLMNYDAFDSEIKELERKVKNKERFKENDDGSASVSISGYDKKTKSKILENYSPKEMKQAVKSIVDYFKEQGVDIFKSMVDKTTGKSLSDRSIDEQFYILMKMFDDSAFDDLD